MFKTTHVLRKRFKLETRHSCSGTVAAGNTIKSLSNSCRPVFFLSIVKTIRSEWAESFSLRQRVQYIMDANEDNAPVRKITNGQKPKTLLQASTEGLWFSFRSWTLVGAKTWPRLCLGRRPTVHSSEKPRAFLLKTSS